MSNQLNREQAIEKAKELGLVHNKRDKTERIIKMINDLTGESNTPEVKKAVKKDGYTKCIVHSGDRENDEVDIVVFHNEENVRIILGEEVTVENKFLNVLRDAVIEQKVPVLDEDGMPTGKSKLRRSPNYLIESIA